MSKQVAKPTPKPAPRKPAAPPAKPPRNAVEPDEVLDEKDFGAAPEATPEQLSAVINMSREQARLLLTVGHISKELKETNEKLRINREVDLPKLMNEARLEHLPLGGGAVVDLDTIVTASIPNPEGKAENAFQRWEVGIAYADKNCPDLVVNQVIITFVKGEEDWYELFLKQQARRKRPLNFKLVRSVHGQTLGKWVRDQDKLGKAVDETALNVHRIKQANVTLPKKDKPKPNEV